MSRRLLTFPCEGAQLMATLDLPDASTATTSGLLIVSGGNEVRAGAWGGQAMLAARVAMAGHPVLRFDRRGVGDSEGANLGFGGSGPDIREALATLRAEVPALTRVVVLGNCDAASALMLEGGWDAEALVLANPWTFDGDGAGHSIRSLRAHYRQRLSNPAALARLLAGKVSLGKLARGLHQAARPGGPVSPLAREMAQGLSRFEGDVAILIAGRDRTAQAFLAGWDRGDPRLHTCPGASHSFVEPAAFDWLEARVLEVLRRGEEG